MKCHKSIKMNTITMIFIVFIVSITLLHILTPDRVFSESENRVLEQLPNISWGRIIDGRFTSNFETYISDQFPYRDTWIAIKSEIELAMGKRENNDVFLGSDGYLLQKFEKPDEGSLKEKVRSLNAFASSLPEVNKYFMLVPNSVGILGDKLPNSAPVASEKGYIEEIEDALHEDIKFVNVYERLYANRNEYLYYKTDHHWTTKGAYYGYRELMEAMGLYVMPENSFHIERATDDFYGTLYSKSGFRHISPDSIDLYIPKTTREYSVKYDGEDNIEDSIYDMAALNKKDKYEVFLGGNYPYIEIDTDARAGKNLLLIKDSYANSIVPFLTEHYDEIHLIDLRYYDGSIADTIREKDIDDILILYNVITFSQDDYIDNMVNK